MNPVLIRDACERTQMALIVSTSKPAPKGESGGGGSVVPPLPLPVGIISAKRELRDLLLDWCSLVREGLDVVRTYDLTEQSMLAWLGEGERAEYLAAHETALYFLEELTAVTKSLENPYLPRMGRKYLGHHGGGDVYVGEGQTEVTLADGTVERIESIRAWNADAMLLQEGTASEVATIIGGYFGHNITHKQIVMAHKNDKRKKAGERLESIRKDGNAHIYKVWDVLNRLCNKEKTTPA